MKNLIKPLLVAFSVSLVTLSASFAAINPSDRPTAAITYKTGIYSTVEGKLTIALDKEKGGAVDISLKSVAGKVVYSQHLGKNERGFRVRLDLDGLPDGVYQLEITNGVETTIQHITLSTNHPSIPNRIVAVN